MQVVLRRVYDGLENESVHVAAYHLLIGRRNDCPLRPQSPLVSRRHCEINVLNIGLAFYEVLIREEVSHRKEAKHVQGLLHRFGQWRMRLPVPACN